MEPVFTSIKRTMGEHIASKKMDRKVNEVAWKTQPIQQKHTTPTNKKHLRIYEEEIHELFNTVVYKFLCYVIPFR